MGSGGGYLKVVIPARSSLVGKTFREMPLQETYSAQVALFSSESEVVEEDLADRVIQAGDTMVLHAKRESLQFFRESGDSITVTLLDYDPRKPKKAWFSVATFAGAVGLVLSLDLPISIGFLTGALVMILGGVLTVEDAYRSVDWKVVFLISGLIPSLTPIGIAMEESGAASLLAETLVAAVQGVHPSLLLFVLGILMTIFSLMMSNVAATVLMVPLVLEMAGTGGLTPQVLVLQVGLCAANSFMLPPITSTPSS